MSRISKVGKILSLVMGVCASVPQVGANPTSVKTQVKEVKRLNGVKASFPKGLPGTVPLNVKSQMEERKRSKMPVLEVKGKAQMGRKIGGPNLVGKDKSQTGKASAPKSSVTFVPGRKKSKMSTGRIAFYTAIGLVTIAGVTYVVYGSKNGDWRLKEVFGKDKDSVKKVDLLSEKIGENTNYFPIKGVREGSNILKNYFWKAFKGIFVPKSANKNDSIINESDTEYNINQDPNQVIYHNFPVVHNAGPSNFVEENNVNGDIDNNINDENNQEANNEDEILDQDEN